MSEVKKDGPDYIPTKQIPKVEVPSNTLDAVLTELRAMRAEGQETRDELTRVVANLEVQSHHLDVLTGRVALMERRQDHAEERGSKHSMGLARGSKTDEDHSAAIGTLVADVSVLKSDVSGLKQSQAKQLDILERLDKVAANPMVRRVAYAIGAAILAYLSTKGWLTR